MYVKTIFTDNLNQNEIQFIIILNYMTRWINPILNLPTRIYETSL